ncbi:hypothetical protein [Mycobacterium shinjukuense]|nr:hypothetical protein [Mycobacterium shinjukuense]
MISVVPPGSVGTPPADVFYGRSAPTVLVLPAMSALWLGPD